MDRASEESEYAHGHGLRPAHLTGPPSAPDAIPPSEGGRYVGTAPSQTMDERTAAKARATFRPPATAPVSKGVRRAYQ